MVINAIEDGFGVAVDDADFCHVQTVADVVALLRSKYQCS
jgi:acyl carrier protein